MATPACKTSSDTPRKSAETSVAGALQSDDAMHIAEPERRVDLTVNEFDDLVFVDKGEEIQVEWNTFGYETCTLEPLGSKATSGTTKLLVKQDISVLLTCVDGPIEERRMLEIRTIKQVTGSMVELKVNGQDQMVAVASSDKVSVRWSTMGMEECNVSPLGSNSLSGQQTYSVGDDDLIFSIACRGDRRTISDTVIVHVNGESAAARPQVNLVANNQVGPLNVLPTDRVHLKWDPPAQEACTVEPAGLDAGVGFFDLGTISESQVIYLQCVVGGHLKIIDAIALNVLHPRVSKKTKSPSVQLSFDGMPGPAVSPLPGKHVLKWQSKRAEKCWISPGNHQGLKGEVAIEGPIGPMTYVAYCLGKNGVGQAVDLLQIFAKANAEPPKVKLFADATKDNLVIRNRESTQVFWTAEGAEECIVYPFNSIQKTGTQWLINMKQKTLILMHCTNAGGASLATLMINVNDGIAILNAEFKVENRQQEVVSIGRGNSLDLSWDFQEWDSCQLKPFKISGLKAQHHIRSLQQTSFINLTCQKDEEQVSFAKIVNVNNDLLESNATGACHFAADEYCSDNMAIVGVLPFQSKNVGMAGWCCPLPSDVLSGEHQFVQKTCPADTLITGSRKGGKKHLRCTGINTDRYQLVENYPANYYEQKDCRCESGWEGSARKSWESLPPSLRFVLARPRSGSFKYQTTEWYFESACSIGNQGGVLTERSGPNCRDAKFRRLAFKNRSSKGIVMTHPEHCRANSRQWFAADRHHVKLDSFHCESIPSHWRKLSIQEL